MGPATRRVLLAMLLPGVLLAASCHAPTDPAPAPPPTSPAWVAVPLPGEPEIVTLTSGAQVLIGTRSAKGTPGLFQSEDDQPPDAVAVAATSGYAKTARWRQIAYGRPGLVAVGGDRGGAHANVRWSVWRGDRAAEPAPKRVRLTEEEQVFWVFGGQEAGDLVGTGYLGDDPVVVGSWAGAHGADIAVWRPHGTRWAREPSRGELASTRTELKSAAAVAATDATLVIAGDVLALGRPPVSHPALWTATDTAGPWRQLLLSGEGRVRAIGCARDQCVVLGTGAGPEPEQPARAWRLTADGVTTDIALPPVTVPDDQALPTPALTTAGSAWLALPSPTGTTLIRSTADEAEVMAGPAGYPVALAAAGDRLYLATRNPDGATRLWRSG